jgi:hypothetical protein
VIVFDVGRMTRRRQLIGGLVVLAVALAGCGSSARPQLGRGDAQRLHSDLAAVRAAAARHDSQQADASLLAFAQQVTRLAVQRKLTSDEARELLTGAQRAQARVAVEVRPATSPATSATPAPAPSAPAAPAGPAPKQDKGKPPKPPKDHGHDKHEGDGDG